MRAGNGKTVVAFGLWFFAFMLLESFVNSSVAALLGAETVNAAYSLGIFCTATGLLAFGLAHARWARECEGAAPIAALVCCVAALGVSCAQGAVLLALSSCVALLACGFVGGFAHLGISRAYGGSPVCGRMVGAATGLAVCVQFLVQNLVAGPAASLACIVVSLVAFVCLWVRGCGQGSVATSAPDGSADARLVEEKNGSPLEPAAMRRHGICLTAAAAILTVIFTLNDSIVVALDASGTLQLFSGVRLFYALGLVVAGLLYDLAPRPTFTVATVAVQMMAVLVPYFLSEPEWYTLNMALFYFYGGFYVMFITAEFVSFAGQMRGRALWASLGRMTRSYACALAVIPVAALYERFGVVSLVAAGVVLNMALVAVCAADMMLTLSPSQDVSTSQEVAGGEIGAEDIDRYAQAIGLTARETEVLALLVTTEDTNDKMAGDLGISRRTLQRHIAHVYDKAGVQSRIGLHKALAARMGTFG